jgi:hypothetical protein
MGNKESASAIFSWNTFTWMVEKEMKNNSRTDWEIGCGDGKCTKLAPIVCRSEAFDIRGVELYDFETKVLVKKYFLNDNLLFNTTLYTYMAFLCCYNKFYIMTRENSHRFHLLAISVAFMFNTESMGKGILEIYLCTRGTATSYVVTN